MSPFRTEIGGLVALKPKQKLTASRLTPMRAIREKCLECCGGITSEVRLCTMPDCALWPYRAGKRSQPETRT